MTTPLFALGLPGMPELFLIAVVVFVLFGAKRLPELARGLGQSMNEFRKAKDEFEREVHSAKTELVSERPAAAEVPAAAAAEKTV